MTDKVLLILNILLFSNKQPVLSRPIPTLTGPCTAEPGLASIHSYGYESKSSPAFTGACPASSFVIQVRNAG